MFHPPFKAVDFLIKPGRHKPDPSEVHMLFGLIMSTAQTGSRHHPIGATAASVWQAAPILIGQGAVGARLDIALPAWNSTAVPALSYQWRRDGTHIPGATSESYVLSAADMDGLISCRVTVGIDDGTSQAMTQSLPVWPKTDHPAWVIDTQAGPHPKIFASPGTPPPPQATAGALHINLL